jgi:small-conductance mechanosensitive channel
MIDFLSGAVTLTYCVAAMYFFSFWRRLRERLFLSFGIAFSLLALNQLLLFVLGVADERGNYAYLLRVLAFVLILAAIVEKNVSRRRR